MKYVLYIDYTYDGGKKLQKESGIEYIQMDAKTIEEAIEEADALWLELNENKLDAYNVYLMRIMVKDGKITCNHGKYTEPYRGVMCKRLCGWLRNTKQNGENNHVVNKCWNKTDKDHVWFDLDISNRY